MNTEDRLFKNASALFEKLKEDGFVARAPVNVDEIAERLKIVVENDYSLEAKGSIGEILFRERQPIIRINPAQNSYGPRRRFTLAHEIGHYCLHSAKSRESFTDSQKTMSRTESYWDPKESEANQFAAQLLMPAALIATEGQAIIDAYKKAMGKAGIPASVFVERMADKFEVSSKAMEYRLKNLGVLKQSSPAPAAEAA